MNDFLEFVLKVFGGIGILILQIVVLAALSFYASRLAANGVGRGYCQSNGFEFLRTKATKAHYILEYRNSGKIERKKFRMVQILGKVFRVEWLK